jgi:hypothetical protein
VSRGDTLAPERLLDINPFMESNPSSTRSREPTREHPDLLPFRSQKAPSNENDPPFAIDRALYPGRIPWVLERERTVKFSFIAVTSEQEIDPCH